MHRSSQLQEEGHWRSVTDRAVTHQPSAGLSKLQPMAETSQPCPHAKLWSLTGWGKVPTIEEVVQQQLSWCKGSLSGLQPCFLQVRAVHWLHTSCGDHQYLLEANPNSGWTEPNSLLVVLSELVNWISSWRIQWAWEQKQGNRSMWWQDENTRWQGQATSHTFTWLLDGLHQDVFPRSAWFPFKLSGYRKSCCMKMLALICLLALLPLNGLSIPMTSVQTWWHYNLMEIFAIYTGAGKPPELQLFLFLSPFWIAWTNICYTILLQRTASPAYFLVILMCPVNRLHFRLYSLGCESGKSSNLLS